MPDPEPAAPDKAIRAMGSRSNIAVIASEAGGALDSLLAENLAVACRSAGRRVLLVDAAPDQACRPWARARAATHLRPLPDVLPLRGMGFGERLARELDSDAGARYDDVLVSAGSCDNPECRSALAAARVVIVPVAVGDADPVGHYRLIARLNAARMFNPDLRVLFAAVTADGSLAGPDLARMRAYAREVMGGHLAQTALPAAAMHAAAATAGACACDTLAGGVGAALDALCREAFGSGRGARCQPHCDQTQTVQG
jgi:chromosome partitioning protein